MVLSIEGLPDDVEPLKALVLTGQTDNAKLAADQERLADEVTGVTAT